MWQYCNHCKAFFYKLGQVCPNCLVFNLWNNPLPDAATKQRIAEYWDKHPAFIRTTPMVEEHALKTEQQQIICAWCNRTVEISATQPVAIQDKNKESTGETRACDAYAEGVAL